MRSVARAVVAGFGLASVACAPPPSAPRATIVDAATARPDVVSRDAALDANDAGVAVDDVAVPTDVVDEELALGFRIFRQACGHCHRPGGGGPSLRGRLFSERRVHHAVRVGLGDEMPEISYWTLSERGYERIIGYLRSIRAVR